MAFAPAVRDHRATMSLRHCVRVARSIALLGGATVGLVDCVNNAWADNPPVPNEQCPASAPRHGATCSQPVDGSLCNYPTREAHTIRHCECAIANGAHAWQCGVIATPTVSATLTEGNDPVCPSRLPAAGDACHLEPHPYCHYTVANGPSHVACLCEHGSAHRAGRWTCAVVHLRPGGPLNPPDLNATS